MAQYKILYKLSHANGNIVDEALDTALTFEIGDGQLAPCLEDCVKNAKIGQLQTFLLEAQNAFGAVDYDAIQTMHRADFEQQLTLKENAVIEFKTPSGEAYVGSIEKIDGDDIKVNFNHLLAGCDVSFQVEVLEQIA